MGGVIIPMIKSDINDIVVTYIKLKEVFDRCIKNLNAEAIDNYANDRAYGYLNTLSIRHTLIKKVIIERYNSDTLIPRSLSTLTTNFNDILNFLYYTRRVINSIIVRNRDVPQQSDYYARIISLKDSVEESIGIANRTKETCSAIFSAEQIIEQDNESLAIASVEDINSLSETFKLEQNISNDSLVWDYVKCSLYTCTKCGKTTWVQEADKSVTAYCSKCGSKVTLD